mgnify:CR=1 FL=1
MSPTGSMRKTARGTKARMKKEIPAPAMMDGTSFPRIMSKAAGDFRYDVLDGITEDGDVKDRHGIEPMGVENICHRVHGRKKTTRRRE